MYNLNDYELDTEKYSVTFRKNIKLVSQFSSLNKICKIKLDLRILIV